MIKNKIKLFTKIIIAILLLVYLVQYVNYDAIIFAIKKSDKLILAFVFILSFLNIYMQFLKWEVVCNSLLKIKDKNKILLSLFYGFSGGIATPIRIGEYVGRKLAFENIGLMKVTIATIIEKFTSLIFVLVFGSISTILFLNKYYSFKFAAIAFLIFVVSIISIYYFIIGVRKSTGIVNYLKEKFTFFKNLIVELKYVKELGKVNLRKLIFYSIFFYFLYIFQYALLVVAFNNGGNLIYSFWAGTIVMFVKSVLSFISFADLGIRESSSILVLSKMSFSKAVGFNSAIFLFLFNLLIPSIIGLILLIKKNK
ncbi:MAG: flippase-like domain-containing protein [Ignavibacteriae bacterium]|nr:flippase-like domain-containing protein [Ignavibacteriota bacterium]